MHKSEIATQVVILRHVCLNRRTRDKERNYEIEDVKKLLRFMLSPGASSILRCMLLADLESQF